ncbi:V4R domain-containing protein [Candidatus Latescibacterota bacterium]
MFAEERNHCRFSWSDLGDIEKGRPKIGDSVPVLLYRLMQYTLRDALITRFDVNTAREIFIQAGIKAGSEFCKNMLDINLDYKEFLNLLKRVVEVYQIGILTIEKVDFDSMEMTISMAEDLDCSGLPISNETICSYDEGFIKGILDEYTQREYHVKEIECWGTGSRTCRFKIHLIKM